MRIIGFWIVSREFLEQIGIEKVTQGDGNFVIISSQNPYLTIITVDHVFVTFIIDDGSYPCWVNAQPFYSEIYRSAL